MKHILLMPCFLIAFLCHQILATNEDGLRLANIAHRPHSHPNSKQVGSNDRQADSDLMYYHGGPVMAAPVAYLIFYGNWTREDKKLVKFFVKHLGKTPWWAINKAYGAGVLTYGGSYHDKVYSDGKNLSSFNHVMNVVMRPIDNGHFPNDQNGIYLVLTSSDVTASFLFPFLYKFCDDFCGYHYFDQTTKLKFSFVGVPDLDTCPGCVHQYISPNESPGVDALLSVVGHELAEAATDPMLDAWYDMFENENADKCSWNFFQTWRTTTGCEYNLIIKSKKFLVQSNWNLDTYSCSMIDNLE